MGQGDVMEGQQDSPLTLARNRQGRELIPLTEDKDESLCLLLMQGFLTLCPSGMKLPNFLLDLQGTPLETLAGNRQGIVQGIVVLDERLGGRICQGQKDSPLTLARNPQDTLLITTDMTCTRTKEKQGE